MNASFQTFRHIRRAGVGGCTACCQVIPDAQRMLVGFAFCSPADLPQFSRKSGRDRAEKRLLAAPIGIHLSSGPEGRLDIVKNIFLYLQGASEMLSKNPDMREGNITLLLNPYNRERPEEDLFAAWLGRFVESL